MTALNTLSDMVYPLVENNTTRNNKTYIHIAVETISQLV